MSAYTYLTTDQLISRKPCKLYSIIVTTDSVGAGAISVYNARTADVPYKVAELVWPQSSSGHFRWRGLELSRGLYIVFVANVDHVTIEWEPIE